MISWILSNDVTGSVTWIGTILGLLGLVLTYMQAKHAKDSADATKTAVFSLEGKLNVANLGFASSQLEVLIRLANSRNADAAQIVFLTVKRISADLFEFLFTKNRYKDEIVVAKISISAIDRQLDLLSLEDGNYKAGVLIKSVRGLSNFLLRIESEIKHESSGSEGSR